MNRTIKQAVEIEGIGVHSGKPVRLRLVPSGGGKVVFRRTDLGGAELTLSPDRALTLNSTVLQGENFRIGTVEHLLATLWAAGIGSCLVELDAEEIPILDGSALPFVQAVEKAGFEELPAARPPLRIVEKMTVEEKGAWITLEPAAVEEGEKLTLTYAISYDHPMIGLQSREMALTWPEFVRDIAPARTFGFLKDVDGLRRQGLALGSSYENTIVLGEKDVVNPPLRFPDEYVRHKLLDLIGDLALLGSPLIGRITAHKAGHRLHLQAVHRLLSP